MRIGNEDNVVFVLQKAIYHLKIRVTAAIILIIICGNLTLLSQVPEIINIESGMKNPGNMFLSDIAYDIQYIPLETNESNLIGNINKIKFNDKHIFVQDANPPTLHVFDKNGKYIRKIGKYGRGPNEYNFLNDFAFSKIKPKVWLLTSVSYKSWSTI